MPGGTCDPASRGMEYNEVNFAGAVTGGSVSGTYHYGWDGVSVRPECHGPVLYFSVGNTGTGTNYVHFQGQRETWITIELASNASVTYADQTACENAGFLDCTDAEGIVISTDPNPPTVTL